MRAEHFEILVEEPSMEAFLRELLPRVLGHAATFEIYPHQCKDDLLAKLPDRLRGYYSWLPDNWRIIVVVDRDDDKCKRLKRQLESLAANAHLRTRTSVGASLWQVANRIAIEELEAWYFGDWQAVEEAYPKVPRSVPRKQQFRDPDDIRGGTWEAFERVLQRAGYFKNGLRKTEAARNLGKRIDPARNSSRSFQIFRTTLLEAAA
ncbi:MAG: DUF4276 family protein [Sulfuritalea sp.]|nr:DUF4276 family protein [Sulfuritalea sp.]